MSKLSELISEGLLVVADCDPESSWRPVLDNARCAHHKWVTHWYNVVTKTMYYYNYYPDTALTITGWIKDYYIPGLSWDKAYEYALTVREIMGYDVHETPKVQSSPETQSQVSNLLGHLERQSTTR
jgi:hypothetical protein